MSDQQLFNMFKIKDEVIPEYAYKYRTLKVFEREEDLQSYVKGKGGALIDKNQQTFLTLIQQDEDDELEMIDRVNFRNDVINLYKETILGSYLRYEKHIDRKMESNLRKIRETKTIGGYNIRPYLRPPQVKIVKGIFYLVVDFAHTVTATSNLWDYVDRNPDILNQYIGKEIKFALNPEKTYEIIEVKPPQQDKIGSVIRYCIDEAKYVKDIQELEARFGKIDYNQPVMYCKFKSSGKESPYPFLPQLSYLLFNLEEFEDTDEIKQIQEYLIFSNEDRIKTIHKIVNSIPDIVDVNPANFDSIKLTSCILLTKDQNGADVPITETNRLFVWINRDDLTPHLPYEVPDFIKGIKIPTFILIDNELKDKRTSRNKVIEIFRKYNVIAEKSPDLPRFDFSSRVFDFDRKFLDGVLKKIRENREPTIAREKISFAFIVGREEYKEHDYYLTLKKRLFDYRIISQNVIESTLTNDFAINNLLIQIMGKLGIKYFVLNRKTPYDYILGVDVGKGEFRYHRIAGVTVVFDSTGKISKIIPFSVPSPGETVNIPRIIYNLYDKQLLDFENKNILILRDGRLIAQERADLKDVSSKLKATFTFMNVIKNHIYRIGTSEYGIATILDDTALLLPHTTPRGAKPIRITQKYIYDRGEEKQEQITADDLQLLYDLTRLNYSRLYNESMSMRLPAPIYYADKFIKALQKGWELADDLLNEGCLYFI